MERLEELAHTLSREVSGKGAALAQLQDQARGCGWWGCLYSPEIGATRGVAATLLCLLPARRAWTPLPSLTSLQLAAARKEATAQKQAAAAALQEAQEQHAREQAALHQAVAAAEAAAKDAQQEVEGVRQRRMGEMEALQARVTALLRTKDATIASLTEQLGELHAAVS